MAVIRGAVTDECPVAEYSCRRRTVPPAPIDTEATVGALSPLHLLIILVVALLIIGPGKLPETGAALGKSIREFRDAVGGKGSDGASDGPADPPIAG